MVRAVRINIEIPPVMVWCLVLFSTFFVIALMQSGVLWTADLKYFWLAFYGLSVVIIIDRLRKGQLFEPIVIVPSAYLLILALGSLFFELVKERHYRDFLFNFIGIGYFALFSGIFLAQNYRYTIDMGRVKKFLFTYPVMQSRALLYSLAGFCLLATMALFAKGGIPMLAADVNTARVNLLTGSGYLNIFFIGLTILPLAVLYDCIARGAKRELPYCHAFAGLVFILLFLTGYRSRTLTFLAEYVGIYYFFNRRKFSLKLLVFLAVFLVSFLAVVGAYRRGEMDLVSVAKEAGIILVARPVMFELVVDNFSPSRFFYGSRYFGDLQKLLPGSQTGANVDLKYEVFPNADQMPEDAGVTPSIIGEAYMNFGAPGVFWIMLLFGLVLGTSYKLMARKPTFLRCAFYFTFVIGMATAVSSGIGTRVVQLIFLWTWVTIAGFLYNWRVRV